METRQIMPSSLSLCLVGSTASETHTVRLFYLLPSVKKELRRWASYPITSWIPNMFTADGITGLTLMTCHTNLWNIRSCAALTFKQQLYKYRSMIVFEPDRTVIISELKNNRRILLLLLIVTEWVSGFFDYGHLIRPPQLNETIMN